VQLRRWPRAGLKDLQAKKFGKGLRARWRLESGKKAIFTVLASENLQAQMRAALGLAG
jgi:hypothetical protein